MKRRIISIITALALCLSLCPAWALAAFAEVDAQTQNTVNHGETGSEEGPGHSGRTAETNEKASGDYNGFHWALNEDGTLTITGSGDMPDANNASWNRHREDIRKVVIENGVTSIGNGAFSGCTNLALVELPADVTSIGAAAFSGCASLNLTELPDSLTSIGYCAFSDCTSLALTTLPSGVTLIRDEAFQNCTSLALTELPAGVTSIGDWVFRGCANLALTTLPAGITSIGRYAFRGCTNLKLTELPNSLTSIGDSAFYDCTSLTLTKLPEALTSIGNYAFNGCTSLTDLTFVSNTPPTLLGSGVFWWCPNLTIHVPDNAAYTTDWPVDVIGMIAHTITVQNDGNGEASASPSSAKQGTTINLTATANSGYRFKEWQVISGGVTISGNSFTMPAENVTVKAVFEQDQTPPEPTIYTITVQANGSGTASASPTSAAQGATINLTATTNSGYHFKEWQVISGDVTISGNSFTMPAADVTVKAVFEQDGAPPEPEAVTKLEITDGISEVPFAFRELEHLNAPEKIMQTMRAAITQTGVPAENTAVYDVTLLVSTNGGATWTPTTKDNFPSGGLTVTLPYPSGTNSGYRFTVVHMFTTSDFGKTPGDTETPAVTNTADGLRFTVTGLSPISVGWTAPATTPDPPTGGNHGGGGWSSNTYAVTVEKSEHGKVTSNRTNASNGSTVTLTVTPDSGYVLDALTVTDSRGNEIKLTAQGGNKYTFTMPSRAVTVKASFVPLPDDTQKPCDGGADCPSRSFTDLGSVGTWYHEAVDYVLQNGLMGGYGNGLFGPNDNLFRAQFAQILFNREGRPVVNYLLQYGDVATGAWYTEAIRWATSRGIVGGYGNGMFGPNDSITREQLAVMLWRYAGSPAATDKELHFTDADKASGYALEALRWAVENGVMSGKGNGQLAPQGLATRGQVAQMLMNFLKNR